MPVSACNCSVLTADEGKVRRADWSLLGAERSGWIARCVFHGLMPWEWLNMAYPLTQVSCDQGRRNRVFFCIFLSMPLCPIDACQFCLPVLKFVYTGCILWMCIWRCSQKPDNGLKQGNNCVSGSIYNIKADGIFKCRKDGLQLVADWWWSPSDCFL